MMRARGACALKCGASGQINGRMRLMRPDFGGIAACDACAACRRMRRMRTPKMRGINMHCIQGRMLVSMLLLLTMRRSSSRSTSSGTGDQEPVLPWHFSWSGHSNESVRSGNKGRHRSLGVLPNPAAEWLMALPADFPDGASPERVRRGRCPWIHCHTSAVHL